MKTYLKAIPALLLALLFLLSACTALGNATESESGEGEAPSEIAGTTDAPSEAGETTEGIILTEALGENTTPLTLENQVKLSYIKNYLKSNQYDTMLDKLTVRFLLQKEELCVVFVEEDVLYPDVRTSEFVGAREFRYRNRNFMLVYSEGNFYRLAEAFSQKLLSSAEVEELYTMHKNENEYLYIEE